MKKYTGFSLIEVLFSFMLISVLVIMMTSVFTSTYAQSMAAYKMPNSYNAAQSNAETSILALENALSARYTLRNGSSGSNSGTADTTGLLTEAEYNQIIADNSYNGATSGYNGEERTIFGQTVKMFYTKSRSVTGTAAASESGRMELDLYSGVGETKIIKRPTPAIDAAKIAVAADEGSSEVEHYNVDPGNTKLKVSGITESSSAGVATDQVSVKWYMASNYKHTLPYMTLDSTKTYRDVLPQYPNDFVMISTDDGGSQYGKIGSADISLTVKEEYLGKFIVATVTPISAAGVYGNSVVTNMIYLSALPSLSSTDTQYEHNDGTKSSNKYLMIIDPSASTSKSDASSWNEEGDATEELSVISSRKAPGTHGAIWETIYSEITGDITINVDGTNTFSAQGSSSTATKSRFLELSDSDKIEADFDTTPHSTDPDDSDDEDDDDEDALAAEGGTIFVVAAQADRTYRPVTKVIYATSSSAVSAMYGSAYDGVHYSEVVMGYEYGPEDPTKINYSDVENNPTENFISAGGAEYGFGTNTRILGANSQTGFKLIQIDAGSLEEFEIGGPDCLLIAELIVVRGTTEEENNEIWSYLAKKYSIEDTFAVGGIDEVDGGGDGGTPDGGTPDGGTPDAGVATPDAGAGGATPDAGAAGGVTPDAGGAGVDGGVPATP